jgi:hypothetical protein
MDPSDVDDGEVIRVCGRTKMWGNTILVDIHPFTFFHVTWPSSVIIMLPDPDWAWSPVMTKMQSESGLWMVSHNATLQGLK